MSNYDAGHYFLTVMAPIRQGNPAEGPYRDLSHVVALRQVLADLPVARQDAATRDAPWGSPFARVPGVHFARLLVLDDLPFNGRPPSNAIWNLLSGADLVQPGAVDHLPQGWLVMTLDMDARDGSDAGLRAAMTTMWGAMGPELARIFAHCEGFAATDAAGWCDYVRRCQVTTTMPFNDYWVDAPPPSPLLRWLGAAAAAILAGAVALWFGGIWTAGLGWLIAAGAAGMVLAAVGLVLWLGTRPFPAAPDSDLPAILKALHVQDSFGDFVRRMQGADPADLQTAFARFLAEEAPDRIDAPTQPAGRLPPRREARRQAAEGGQQP